MGCRSHSLDGRMSLEIFSSFASIELNLAFQMTCQPGSIICIYVNLYLCLFYFNKSTVGDFPSCFHSKKMREAAQEALVVL
jgi:hypothetical protein